MILRLLVRPFVCFSWPPYLKPCGRGPSRGWPFSCLFFFLIGTGTRSVLAFAFVFLFHFLSCFLLCRPVLLSFLGFTLFSLFSSLYLSSPCVKFSSTSVSVPLARETSTLSSRLDFSEISEYATINQYNSTLQWALR